MVDSIVILQYGVKRGGVLREWGAFYETPVGESTSLVEVDAAVALSAIMVAPHFIYVHGRPTTSELASRVPGVEEGLLRLEPHQFLFGAQTFFFSALYPPGIFLISDSQFFPYCGNLRPPGIRAPPAFGRC